jgi:hypothetical protein
MKNDTFTLDNPIWAENEEIYWQVKHESDEFDKLRERQRDVDELRDVIRRVNPEVVAWWFYTAGFRAKGYGGIRRVIEENTHTTRGNNEQS